MADIQRQFMKFDEAIRLKHLDENATLRDKRDAVLRRLDERLAALRKEGAEVPKYDTFLQGSYQMGTGIIPAQGHYDIDIGLRFHCPPSQFKDPVALKALVHRALHGHTREVVVRRSCVTVYYQRDGEPVYHVDLAVYTQEPRFLDEPQLFIAKGKTNSGEEKRCWEPSDPLGLIRWVERRHSDREEERQFLRVIRALKRWKGENFKAEGASAPTGIMLTVAAGRLFRPSIGGNWLWLKAEPNDLRAALALVGRLVGEFERDGSAGGEEQYKLVVKMPVAPENNLCELMSPAQMTVLRQRLLGLKAALEFARDEPDPTKACERMRREFGTDFPAE